MARFLLLMLSVLASWQANAATKNILVTGYWPPTNEMLRELSPKDPARWQGKNWRGLGYDVYAYFPSNEGDTALPQDFAVDFASVYNDFFKFTDLHKPVAILSFGAGMGPWEIESVFPAFYHEWFASGEIPSTMGVKTLHPVPASLALNVTRRSSLPRQAIHDAVKSLGDKGLDPWIDEQGGAGDYVCGFTGYLESWYRDQHQSPLDPAQVKAAGFIHVNGDLPRARASMEASLEALIKSLD